MFTDTSSSYPKRTKLGIRVYSDKVNPTNVKTGLLDFIVGRTHTPNNPKKRRTLPTRDKFVSVEWSKKVHRQSDLSVNRSRRQSDNTDVPVPITVRQTNTPSIGSDEQDLPFLEQPTDVRKVMLLFLYTFPPGMLTGYVLVAALFFLRYNRLLCCEKSVTRCLPEGCYHNQTELQVSRHYCTSLSPTDMSCSADTVELERCFHEDKLFFLKTGKDQMTGEVVGNFEAFRNDPYMNKEDLLKSRMKWWLANDRRRCLKGIFTDPFAREDDINLAASINTSLFSDQISSVSEPETLDMQSRLQPKSAHNTQQGLGNRGQELTEEEIDSLASSLTSADESDHTITYG